jgi:hypothetical protein
MPFPNFQGRKRLWTRENVLAGLVRAAAVIRGPLPCCDADYNRLKKDRLDWPTSHRILEYYGSMARAWIAAGVKRKRISLGNIGWTEEELDILESRAGAATLEEIGQYLRRSAAACKRRLYSQGITARANQGFLSAAELAQEYNCSCNRIRTLLAAGAIRGRYDQPRHRWQVDPVDITPEVELLLITPKRTWKNGATDLGDYYRRYGLRRTLVNGKIEVISE